MSDESEEENFCFFGKPLDPYDEDAFPKKRPITVEEQIATDAQGRRRFHGAFTGGFSAGFFNTVGSLEGWQPSEFKSTRQEKASRHVQHPEDFMDEEDIGQHGIAPQTVKATNEFNTSKKRHRKAFSDGPIPGEPVLHSLLTSGNETVGYLLLKNMGIQNKIDAYTEEAGSSTSSQQKVYGCHIPKQYEVKKSITNKQYEIPEIYKQYLTKPKANTFGLGYEGLDRSHINLFSSSNLVLRGKNNQKMTISGQAFGVGAFEEDDDDIYAKDDMSKYDFEMTKEKKKQEEKKTNNLIFDMFTQSKIPLINKKVYPPPTIPQSFSGKHKIRKSRFEPIESHPEETTERKNMNPSIRAKYLGENNEKNYTESKPVIIESKKDKKHSKEEVELPIKKKFDISDLLNSDRFVSASKTEDTNNILATVEKYETEHGTEQMRDAAKMKMFGALTRISIDWYPSPLLCKRFNVPEPLLDKSELQKNRKRTKNLIFEYQKHADVEPALLPVKKNEEKFEEIQEKNMENNKIIEDMIGENLTKEENSEDNQKKNIEKNLDEAIAPKDETEKINIEQNIDLFKAIFLSSSESESEDEKEETKKEETEKPIPEETKANILLEPLIPKIKPLKDGILSNVHKFVFTKPNKNEEKSKNEENSKIEESKKQKDHSDFYGPTLPKNVGVTVKDKPLQTVSSSSEDEWIEKDAKQKKKKSKHKKEKKHKKDKHKRKKHKNNH